MNSIEFSGFTSEVTVIGKVNENDDGDHNTLYEVMFDSKQENLSDFLSKIEDWKDEFLSVYFPALHCQHSYDCCGDWYPNRGELIHVDAIYGYLIVSQRWVLNI